MANDHHLGILRKSVENWNRWRSEHPDIRPDLSGVNLSGGSLTNASNNLLYLMKMAGRTRESMSEPYNGWDLRRANLSGANLTDANLSNTNFSGADLTRACLNRTNLSWANLEGANLKGANLVGADLYKSNLHGADLSGADLELCRLLDTVLNRADLTSCRVYGVSAWGVELEGAIQTDLIITPTNHPIITVDHLEVAQFIYLLLSNQKIRAVIDTITSKVVLILGRFTPERKAVLDALRDTLRERNYLPVVFDFDKPASRDLTETVSTLAHLARFIIADITDPRSIPQELQAIVPDLAVPVQPIIARPQQPWGMFVDFPKKYHWVLEAHEYDDLGDLLGDLQTNVIAPAEAKAKQLAAR
jgi:uncharacterized protein YjbI with pentapeptide repeats